MFGLRPGLLAVGLGADLFAGGLPSDLLVVDLRADFLGTGSSSSEFSEEATEGLSGEESSLCARELRSAFGRACRDTLLALELRADFLELGMLP